MDDLRIGVIGCGRIARVHAEAYQQVAGGRLVACTDAIKDVADRFAADFGVEATAGIDSLLSRGDLDAVIIATPNSFHADLTISALQAGKHVFCQKPIALTVEDADKVEQAVSASGDRVLQYGFVLRFTPPVPEIADLVQAGELGEIISTTAVIYGWEPNADWFYDLSTGGGVVLDTQIHHADLVNWLCGEVEHVYAEGEAYLLEGSKKHGSPDNASALLHHTSGANSSVYVTWTAGHGDFVFSIFGTEGSATIDLVHRQGSMVFRKQATATGPSGWSQPDFVWPMAYRAEQQYFVDWASGNVDGSQAAGPTEAKRALELSLAVQRSLETGAPERLGA